MWKADKQETKYKTYVKNMDSSSPAVSLKLKCLKKQKEAGSVMATR